MRPLHIMRLAVVAGVLAGFAAPAEADSSKEELRKDLKDLDLVGSWVYDDLDAGFAAARTESKPLLVVFR